MTPEAFVALTRPFPEPHLLVSVDGEVRAMNPGAVRLLGAGSPTPEGIRFQDLVEDEPGAVQGILRRAASSGSFVPATFSVAGGSGSAQYRCDAAALRMGSSPTPTALMLRLRPHSSASERFLALNEKIEELAREVHQRRQTESVLQEQAIELETMNEELGRAILEMERQSRDADRARQEAEKASRAKSEFLAVMSHELRTPLNAILGYADLLDAGVKGELNDEQRHQLARIRRSGLHLINLIEEVLTFSRIDAGTEKVSLERTDLVALIRETVELMEPVAKEKGLTLRGDIGMSPTQGVTDPPKVAQILVNLLSNAIKFTPAGEVRVHLDVEGDCVVVEVSDTGPGIPPAHRNRIFQPFEQGDLFPTQRPPGTGLGLAVSRELARLLGGELVLVEGDGPGSTFRLHLPLEAAPES